MVRKLASVVIILAVIAVIIGAVFVAQGVAKNNQMKEAMRVEQVSFSVVDPAKKGEIVDSMASAQALADTIREHRRGIAPTYGDLLGGGKYDPTNPKDLTYAQALNLENYLYLAVVGFGLIYVTLAAGGFMLVTGLALGFTGIALLKIPQG